MKLYPYKAGSKSAKALAEALGIKRLKLDGSLWKKPQELVLNWGSSSITNRNWFDEQIFLNCPLAVKDASNKRSTFRKLNGISPIPPWSETKEGALKWLLEGITDTVVCRTILTGHSGAGIVLADNPENVVDAPLYTAYLKKKNEYRLHVMHDNVFFVQRKARSREVPDEQVNWKIRNHKNGFIYAHKDVDVPAIAKQAAITAVATLGLDFGAVDMLEDKHGHFYVLEINTACGLEGTTLEKYCEQFRKFL